MARGLGRLPKRKNRPDDDEGSDGGSQSLFVPVDEVQPRRAPRATAHLGIPNVRVAITTPHNVHLTQIRPSDVRNRRRGGPSTSSRRPAPQDTRSASQEIPPTPESPNVGNVPLNSTLHDVGDGLNAPNPAQQEAAAVKARKRRKTRDQLKTQAKRWKKNPAA